LPWFRPFIIIPRSCKIPPLPALSAFDDEAYQELCAKTEGTTINSQTLLATDYLNHFNEVVMLLEMIPDMPDMMDMVQEW